PDGISAESAACQLNLGSVLEDIGKIGEAEQAHRLAVELYQKLDDRATRAHRVERASAQSSLAYFLANTERRTEAQDHFRDAIAELKAIVKELPHSAEARNALAITFNNRGNGYAPLLGRGKDAETDYLQALPLQEELVKEFPNTPEYRERWAMTLENLGM